MRTQTRAILLVYVQQVIVPVVTCKRSPGQREGVEHLVPAASGRPNPAYQLDRLEKLDPKLVFWSFALVNLAVIVALAATAVWRIRRGDVRLHRRLMLTAAALVGLFLASFLVKGRVLGGEAVSDWAPLHRGVLYVHECFVVSSPETEAKLCTCYSCLWYYNVTGRVIHLYST